MKILRIMSSMAIATVAALTFSAQAASVDVTTARMEANNFVKSKMASKGMFNAPATADLKLAHSEASSVEGNAYYVFNIQGGGWVIIAGDDRAKQVLAYGDKGNIDMNNLPDNMKGYLNMLKGQIETAQAYKGETVPVKASKRSAAVEPLLKTDWGQSEPMNRLCPPNGSGKITSVGCGPLAMAQIMYYWKYPNEVAAVPGYSISWSQYMSELPATTFDYSLMLDNYYTHNPETGNPTGYVAFTEEQANEVAKLCRYCGQACKARYGNANETSTGSYTYDQRDAFKTFGYNDNIQLIGYDPSYYCDNSNKYTEQAWKELIYSELEAGHIHIQGFLELSQMAKGKAHPDDVFTSLGIILPFRFFHNPDGLHEMGYGLPVTLRHNIKRSGFPVHPTGVLVQRAKNFLGKSNLQLQHFLPPGDIRVFQLVVFNEKSSIFTHQIPVTLGV